MRLNVPGLLKTVLLRLSGSTAVSVVVVGTSARSVGHAAVGELRRLFHIINALQSEDGTTIADEADTTLCASALHLSRQNLPSKTSTKLLIVSCLPWSPSEPSALVQQNIFASCLLLQLSTNQGYDTTILPGCFVASASPTDLAALQHHVTSFLKQELLYIAQQTLRGYSLTLPGGRVLFLQGCAAVQDVASPVLLCRCHGLPTRASVSVVSGDTQTCQCTGQPLTTAIPGSAIGSEVFTNEATPPVQPYTLSAVHRVAVDRVPQGVLSGVGHILFTASSTEAVFAASLSRALSACGEGVVVQGSLEASAALLQEQYLLTGERSGASFCVQRVATAAEVAPVAELAAQYGAVPERGGGEDVLNSLHLPHLESIEGDRMHALLCLVGRTEGEQRGANESIPIGVTGVSRPNASNPVVIGAKGTVPVVKRVRRDAVGGGGGVRNVQAVSPLVERGRGRGLHAALQGVGPRGGVQQEQQQLHPQPRTENAAVFASRVPRARTRPTPFVPPTTTPTGTVAPAPLPAAHP